QTVLTLWEPQTGHFRHISAVEHLARNAPSAFAEDTAGNLWIGFVGGGLARLHGDAVDFVLSGDDMPEGAVTDLLVDNRHRLWAATASGGALRLDDPTAPQPRPTAYTGSQGLSSDRVLCLVEDLRGALYLSHGQGIDRLDAETGGVRALTSA